MIIKEKTKILLRLVLGITFVFSAYSKLIAPGAVEVILIDQGIISSRDLAGILVRLLIGLEFGIGFLFFQPYMLKKVVIPVSFLFLVGFSFYLLYSGLILGDNQNCGCFGEVIKLNPIESLFKNIFFIFIVLWLYKLETKSKHNLFIPTSILILSIVSVFILSPIKSADDFRFSKYIHFQDYGRVDLSSGEKFIGVINTDCNHCREMVNEIIELKKIHNNFAEFFFLIFSDGSIDIDSFKTLTGFNFPYHIIDINEFFDLIGNYPPRIYYLKDGNVSEIWDDNFSNRIEKYLESF